MQTRLLVWALCWILFHGDPERESAWLTVQTMNFTSLNDEISLVLEGWGYFISIPTSSLAGLLLVAFSIAPLFQQLWWQTCENVASLLDISCFLDMKFVLRSHRRCLVHFFHAFSVEFTPSFHNLQKALQETLVPLVWLCVYVCVCIKS